MALGAWKRRQCELLLGSKASVHTPGGLLCWHQACDGCTSSHGAEAADIWNVCRLGGLGYSTKAFTLDHPVGFVLADLFCFSFFVHNGSLCTMNSYVSIAEFQWFSLEILKTNFPCFNSQEEEFKFWALIFAILKLL